MSPALSSLHPGIRQAARGDISKERPVAPATSATAALEVHLAPDQVWGRVTTDADAFLDL